MITIWNRFVAAAIAAVADTFSSSSILHTTTTTKILPSQHWNWNCGLVWVWSVFLCVFRSTFMQRYRTICIYYSFFDYIALRFLYLGVAFSQKIQPPSPNIIRKGSYISSSSEYLFFIVCNSRALCLFCWFCVCKCKRTHARTCAGKVKFTLMIVHTKWCCHWHTILHKRMSQKNNKNNNTL